jgi:hypothetical protein
MMLLAAAAAGADVSAAVTAATAASPTMDSDSEDCRLRSELRDLLMEERSAPMLLKELAEAAVGGASVCAAEDAHAMADDDGRC